ncbi:hypothetical protein [Embleya hyalina]|uniref:hypothetical protein n=1 Tax=Embleya hyalina TaxID=516124 RepID=UPI001FE28710|nr:hypothetical protein [Embleya hyalina]
MWGVDDELINRDTDPDAWAAAVEADVPLVIQMDDGTDSGDMIPTSSASMPSLVRLMLEQLDVRPNHHVLELGTGTGWSSALLSAALTEGSMITIEIDEQVAGAAHKVLRERCRTVPTMVVGDGLEGHEPGAPYDRLIATMAVRHVPYAWVEQVKPGGVIVTPWGNSYNVSGLLRLCVDGSGTASGRFVGNVNFMWARSQRSAFDGRPFVGDVIPDPETARVRHTLTDPRPLRREHADFAIGLRLPDVEQRTFFGRADRADEFTVWYSDGKSWAAIDYKPGADSFEVSEHGPRDLWAEIEAAYEAWLGQGEPTREQHGVTVTRDGRSTWLEGPNGRVEIGPASIT